MPKASFFTLGCRLNQTESAIMAKSLSDRGYVITPEQENADLCIINTCTVTNQSDAKSRQAIRRIVKKNPKAIIAVVGCFSQLSAHEVLKISGVNIILGNQNKLNLVHYLTAYQKTGVNILKVDEISKDSFTIETLGQELFNTRANLKIQDGCDFICSFCVLGIILL